MVVSPASVARLHPGPSSIRDLARAISVTHSAASQTVAQMSRSGLVTLATGADARQRIVHLTARAESPLVAADRFRFLNVERDCAAAADWQPRGVDKLWIYHLHYFDDLNARDAAPRRPWHRQLLERWVAENPPAAGDAWEPFPLSRRIVNWVKWTLRGEELPAACRASLAVQARWLGVRVEYHLRGNHLLANAAALVHVGLYFTGPEAERWCAYGMEIIARQLREQVLADGGHFERSPMYHAGFTEDLLDTMGVMQAYGRTADAAWSGSVSRLLDWLEAMSHPDGGIAFFNDAAFGVSPQAAQLRGRLRPCFRR